MRAPGPRSQRGTLPWASADRSERRPRAPSRRSRPRLSPPADPPLPFFYFDGRRWSRLPRSRKSFQEVCLCLLIFQFLAAALSAGGGARAKFNAGRGSCCARPAVLRRPVAAGPRGSPGASRTNPLRGRPQLPPRELAGALGSDALRARGGPCGCDETEGARSRLPGAERASRPPDVRD